MKTTYEKVELSVTTKKNATPEGKLLAGRLSIHKDAEKAEFTEEDNLRVICGETKSKRLFRGNRCSVWWRPEDKSYLIRVRIKEDNPTGKFDATCDFENCLTFIGNDITRRKEAER